MKRLLPFLVLSLLSWNSFGQFEVISSPTTVDLYDVVFLNPYVGYAVGDSGVILQSISKGTSWDIVHQSDQESLTKVAFFTDLDGLAIGSDIFLTSDGGLTWIELDRQDDHTDLAILNDSTVLVSSTEGGLIRSKDKGMTWEVVLGDDTGKGIGFLDFVNEQIGYGMKSGPTGSTEFSLKTSDGGESWDTIEALSGQDFTIIEAFEFASEDLGFRAGWYNGHLTRTTDAALNWTQGQYTDSSLQGQWYDLHIDSQYPEAYFVCGWYGSIARSTDGGINWDRLESGVSNTTSLYGIFFLDDQMGWVVGHGGTILRTTNGGGTVQTENPQPTGQIKVHPNPATHQVHLVPENDMTIMDLQLWNTKGHLVLSIDATKQFNVDALPAGWYFLKINTSRGPVSEKLLIQH